MQDEQKQNELDWLVSARTGSVEHLKAVQKLDPQLDVYCKDDLRQDNALHLAAQSGNRGALEYLLQQMDPLVQNKDGENVMHKALQHHHFDLVKVLLKHPKAPQMCAQSNTVGQTVLHYAAVRDEYGTITQQVCALSDASARDKKGRTALHYAASWDSWGAMKELLQAEEQKGGCKKGIHSVDREGKTPLHMSAKEGSERCVQLLLSAGSDPNAVDNKGNSALHVCLEEGNSDSAQLLIPVTDMSIRNKAGKLAIDHAQENGYGQLVKQMQKKMAMHERKVLEEQVEKVSQADVQAIASARGPRL